MREDTQLEYGRIPPHTVCPFRARCPSSVPGGLCKHKGVEHTVAFSCAYARLFDMFKEEEK